MNDVLESELLMGKIANVGELGLQGCAGLGRGRQGVPGVSLPWEPSDMALGKVLSQH